MLQFGGRHKCTALIRDGEVDCGASRMTEDDKNDEQLGILGPKFIEKEY